MTDAPTSDGNPEGEPQKQLPGGHGWEKAARGVLQVAGGAIPFAGGILSAAAGHWSEQEQARINDFLRAWVQMLEDELREKQETIAEIASRLDCAG